MNAIAILFPSYIEDRRIDHNMGGAEERLQRAGVFHPAAWTAFAR